jgi:predicted nucleic acid-binding protein
MTGRAFVDTNVVVYAYDLSDTKRDHALDLLAQRSGIVISAQVVSEFVSVMTRKGWMASDDIASTARNLLARFELVPLDEAVLSRALGVHARYRTSWWDALIVAAAIEAQCDVLYSEDLADGQAFEGLTIRNPFAV